MGDVAVIAGVRARRRCCGPYHGAQTSSHRRTDHGTIPTAGNRANYGSRAGSDQAFPEDARWNAERQAVEFGVEIGEYHDVVRVPRRVLQRLLPKRPTPQRCVEAYYLQRTRFESIVERKL